MQDHIYMTQGRSRPVDSKRRDTSPYPPSFSHRIGDIPSPNVVPLSLFHLPSGLNKSRGLAYRNFTLPASPFSLRAGKGGPDLQIAGIFHKLPTPTAAPSLHRTKFCLASEGTHSWALFGGGR